MNRIIAIALLTFRNAVRSRVLAMLAAAVVIIILWLPFVIKGDGAPSSTVRLYLNYALGSAVVLLSISALWTGADAFSREVESRRIQLVTTKPVRILQIWAGKWLGLMLMNALLLGIAGSLTYGILRWITRPSVLSGSERAALAGEVFCARTGVPCIPDPALLPVDVKDGIVPGGRVGAGPGGELTWFFTVPDGVRPGEQAQLQYRFVSSRGADTLPSKMIWKIGSDDDPARHVAEVSSSPGITHRLLIPYDAAPPGSTARVTLINAELERPGFMVFSAANGVQVLLRAGGFEMNYLRAMIVILARLSFFSSLGLAAGAVFSFPVAVFASFAFLFATGFSRFIETIAGAGLSSMPELRGSEAVVFFDPLIQGVFTVMNWIMPPLWRFDPFELLAYGSMVSWRFTGLALLIFAGIYSAAPALLSAWLFRRRELGLPG